MTTLAEYFEKTAGRGVLATADRDGRVDAAIYARPHVLGEEEVCFVMADRLTHSNVQQNPKAVYLFTEEENKHEGRRLFLSKVSETSDPEAIAKIARKKLCTHCSDDSIKEKKYFLVTFKIEKVLPLVSGE